MVHQEPMGLMEQTDKMETERYGTDGLAALAVTNNLGASDANCPDGGVQIDVGVDDNDNGVLFQ